jgi:hypothetical protein
MPRMWLAAKSTTGKVPVCDFFPQAALWEKQNLGRYRIDLCK